MRKAGPEHPPHDESDGVRLSLRLGLEKERPPASSKRSSGHSDPTRGSPRRIQFRPSGLEDSLRPPRARLRREPAGIFELRIKREWLYLTPTSKLCQRSRRWSRGKPGRVPLDSMTLAPPRCAFAPCKFRIAANEDALPRLGQGIKQIRGGEAPLLQHGSDGVTEYPKPVLLGDQHKAFTNPQHSDGSPGVQAQFITILLGDCDLPLPAGFGSYLVFLRIRFAVFESGAFLNADS